MKKQILSIALLVISSCTFAQSFIPAFDRFSGKEVAYFNMLDGSKIEGTIDDLDRRKGLIEEITIIPTGEKKKKKLQPKDIKNMYLPGSGLNKIGNAMDQAFDAQKWKNNDVNMEIISKGYAYFEMVTTQIKRDKEMLMLQLLNPAFSAKIKVFHDPLAQESMGFGVAGVTLAGSDEKSYYVQVGSENAKRVKKKDYDDEYLVLYKSCPDLLKKLKDDHRWTNFDKHLIEYTSKCN
jgi:hypothetical protein